MGAHCEQAEADSIQIQVNIMKWNLMLELECSD